jgi:hypothetical protein
MSKLIPLAALSLVLAACSSKPSWAEYKDGPVTLQFPCKPEKVSNTNTTKCTTSDGSEWRLAAVDKNVEGEKPTPEAILAEAKDYADQIPNGEIIQVNAFPVKWRESRRTNKVESWMYYKDGWEYTASVTYNTEQPPASASEFFAKVKME